jgi:hypothetical protein
MLSLAAPILAACALLGSTGTEPDWNTHARLLAAGDPPAAAALVNETRDSGPAALDALFTSLDTLLQQQGAASTDEDRQAVTDELHCLEAFIDAVGAQRYCSVSRLFWHTDLAAALAAARESGRPILSLRLLGRLTDELSCANSRFFRTTLYANTEIAELLRTRFILHWESVRPVPVLTVDYGDGRKLVRTITGNSAHYLLDADARPLDVLPGLYGPAAFRDWLLRAESLAHVCATATDAERNSFLTAWHRERLDAIHADWSADLTALGLALTTSPDITQNGASPRAPAAVPATQIAKPKAAVELRAVRAVTMTREELRDATTDDVWEAIARQHTNRATLDESSRALIARENPAALATAAALLAPTKRRVELPILERVFANLQASVALDTVRNEYELHARVHEWFTNGEAGQDVAQLNRRVYADLFLMPDDDPWLGLGAPDSYTGLPDAGLVTTE